MAFTNTTIYSTDVATMETEFGTAATATLAGTAYACLLDSQVNSSDLEEGGFRFGYVGRFYLRANLATAAIGDEVIIGGVTYRVGPDITVDLDGVGSWYKYRELL